MKYNRVFFTADGIPKCRHCKRTIYDDQSSKDIHAHNKCREALRQKEEKRRRQKEKQVNEYPLEKWYEWMRKEKEKWWFLTKPWPLDKM